MTPFKEPDLDHFDPIQISIKMSKEKKTADESLVNKTIIEIARTSFMLSVETSLSRLASYYVISLFMNLTSDLSIYIYIIGIPSDN